ncbi:MAG: hypothetical protein ACOX7R_08250 [Acetivibrionales bacterium]|jgi:hypothetical protein
MNTDKYILALNKKGTKNYRPGDGCYPYYVMPCDCAGPGGLPQPPRPPIERTD